MWNEARRRFYGRLWMKKPLICRDFPSSTRLSTGVEDGDPVRIRDNGETQRAATSGSTALLASVENFNVDGVVYTARSSGSGPLSTAKKT